MIQHSPGTTTKRGPPPRTMSTRQSAKASTSGSGEQNPVAPNTTHNQQEDEDLASSRRSLSPPSGRRSRSAPNNNKNMAHVVFLQPEVSTGQDRHQQVSHIAPVIQQTANQQNVLQRSSANDASAPETIAAQLVPENLEGSLNHAINSLPIDWTSLIRAIRAPLPTLPTSSGQDHEDPNAFLRECEEHFTQSTTEPSQWTRLAGKSLGESAAKWWEMYKSLSLTWYKFREVMLQRYASASTLMRLRA